MADPITCEIRFHLYGHEDFDPLDIDRSDADAAIAVLVWKTFSLPFVPFPKLVLSLSEHVDLSVNEVTWVPSNLFVLDCTNEECSVEEIPDLMKFWVNDEGYTCSVERGTLPQR